MTWSEGKRQKDFRSLIGPGGDVLPCVTRSKSDVAAAKLALLSTNAREVGRAATASFFVRVSASENAALEIILKKNI